MLNFFSHQGVQVKTTVNYDNILIGMAEEKIVKTPDAVEHTNWTSYILTNVKWYSYSGKEFGNF